MINAKRIAEMKLLSDVATPGPWEKLNSAGVFTELGAVNAKGVKADDNDGWQIAECCGLVTNVDSILTELTHTEENGNAQFIAKSRQFVPDIIAAYEETKKQSAFWYEQFVNMTDAHAEQAEELAKAEYLREQAVKDAVSLHNENLKQASEIAKLREALSEI